MQPVLSFYKVTKFLKKYENVDFQLVKSLK